MKNTRFYMSSSIFLVVVAVLLGNGSATESDIAPRKAQRQPATVHGLPTKIKGLSDLYLLDQAKDLKAVQKTEVLLTWFVEERRRPTPTSTGLGGGPVDSNYIQTQISQMLAGDGDLRAMKWLATSPKLRSSAVRHALFISLNDVQDDRGRIALLDTLMNDPNPYMRERAAVGLGYWKHDDVIFALRNALSDPYFVTYEPTHIGLGQQPGLQTFRPVRRAAAEALRNFENWPPAKDVWLDNWKKKFNERMEGYDEFIVEHRADLDRMLVIANRNVR